MSQESVVVADDFQSAVFTLPFKTGFSDHLTVQEKALYYRNTVLSLQWCFLSLLGILPPILMTLSSLRMMLVAVAMTLNKLGPVYQEERRLE